MSAIICGDPTTDSGERRIIRHLRWHAQFMAGVALS